MNLVLRVFLRNAYLLDKVGVLSSSWGEGRLWTTRWLWLMRWRQRFVQPRETIAGDDVWRAADSHPAAPDNFVVEKYRCGCCCCCSLLSILWSATRRQPSRTLRAGGKGEWWRGGVRWKWHVPPPPMWRLARQAGAPGLAPSVAAAAAAKTAESCLAGVDCTTRSASSTLSPSLSSSLSSSSTRRRWFVPFHYIRASSSSVVIMFCTMPFQVSQPCVSHPLTSLNFQLISRRHRHQHVKLSRVRPLIAHLLTSITKLLSQVTLNHWCSWNGYCYYRPFSNSFSSNVNWRQ